jgi:hypothetical protein
MADVRYMDIFIDIFLVFVLFLQQSGHSRMARNFGRVIGFWDRVGCFVV